MSTRLLPQSKSSPHVYSWISIHPQVSTPRGCFSFPLSSCADLPIRVCADLPIRTFSLVSLRRFTNTPNTPAQIYQYACADLPIRLRRFTNTPAQIYQYSSSYPQELTRGFIYFPWSLITINFRTISGRGKPSSQR